MKCECKTPKQCKEVDCTICVTCCGEIEQPKQPDIDCCHGAAANDESLEDDYDEVSAEINRYNQDISNILNRYL